MFADLLDQPPLPALLEMARATSRVRLGAACLNPYTQHPYEIAGGLAALDAACGGRAYLGLARGAWLQAIGIEQRRPLDHLRDTAAIVRALLSGDERGYAGAAYRLAPGIRLRYPVSGRLPPLLIGAWGPRGAALAGEIANEVKVGGSANPAVVPLIRERVAAGCRTAGRSPDSVRVVLGAVTVVDRDAGPRPADGPGPRWPGTWRSWRTSTRPPSCRTGSLAGSGTWSRRDRTRPPEH